MTFERHLTVENLRTWINIRANFFLGKGVWCVKAAWEVISWTKIQACSSKNIVPRHDLLMYSFFSLEQIQPSIDCIIFATIY